MSDPENDLPEVPESEPEAGDVPGDAADGSEMIGASEMPEDDGGLESLLGSMDDAQADDDEVSVLADILGGSDGEASMDMMGGGHDTPASEGPRLKGVEEGDLKKILRLKVPFKVILAERETMIRDLLTLQVGSLIEFEKLSDELLDVYVNEQLLGVGEVVKIHENFGVRIRDMISIEERIKKLGL